MVIEASQILTLKVADGYPTDERRGIARIVPPLMSEFGLRTGDVVELTSIRDSSQNVGSIVFPGKGVDRGIGIIRVDRFTRDNLGVVLGDQIRVKQVTRQDATCVTCAPAKETIRLLLKPDLFKARMLNHAVVRGEIIPLLGQVRVVPPSYRPLDKSILQSLPVRMREVEVCILDTEPQELLSLVRTPSLKSRIMLREGFHE